MAGSGNPSRSASCGHGAKLDNVRCLTRRQRLSVEADARSGRSRDVTLSSRRRGAPMWCHVCRDTLDKNEDNIVECTICPKRFHLECLQEEGIIHQGETVDCNNWLCPQCLDEVEEDEITNDEKCFLCRKVEIEDDCDGKMIMCDGCPNSYHMSCLSLSIEPDDEKWFCPECNPSAFKVDEIRRLGRGNAVPHSGDVANSSTCYVCQRPGKLLGCDFCVNSFHPSCLVDVDWDSIGEEWECPVCRGFDPLANQMHKRWTRVEMEEKRKARHRCIERLRSKVTKYRSRFLLVHQKDLGPFVNSKILQSLARGLKAHVNAAPDKKGGGRANGSQRLSVERPLSDILEMLEDEATEEAEKFTNHAYRACRYPSGRRIEGIPLRDGINLKPHQVDGVDWLLRSFLTGGAILADEMGLGKTIQTLCLLSYLNAMKIEGPHLIVVPLSTVGNWLREIHRFTPCLTHIKICGSKNERQHAMQDRLAAKGLYDLYVTTYETVKVEEEFFVGQIPHWQCIVLDEAHRIKNASGAIRHSLDRIRGNMRLLLTGTPLQNNAQELFTLINFLMPDVFRDSLVIDRAFSSNAVRSCDKKQSRTGRTKSQSAVRGDMDVDSMFKHEDLEKIRHLLDCVMLRRLKEQTISLPRKIFHDLWLPICDSQVQWYRRLLEIKALQEEARCANGRANFRKMLGLVIKMRILCAHPKGVCARESQLQRLQAFFSQEDSGAQNEVLEAARKLQQVEGKEHLESSAKLVFLDKLMCRLHRINCKFVPNYEKDYMNHKHDRATYQFYQNHEELIRKEIAAGRKPPRRPKRSELAGLAEYQALFELGLPEMRECPSGDSLFLQDGLYAAEPVHPVQDPLVRSDRGDGVRDSVESSQSAEAKRESDCDQLISPYAASVGVEVTMNSVEWTRERRSRKHIIIDDDDDTVKSTLARCTAHSNEISDGINKDDAIEGSGIGSGFLMEGHLVGGNESGVERRKFTEVGKSPHLQDGVEAGLGFVPTLKDVEDGASTICCTGSPASNKENALQDRAQVADDVGISTFQRLPHSDSKVERSVKSGSCSKTSSIDANDGVASKGECRSASSCEVAPEIKDGGSSRTRHRRCSLKPGKEDLSDQNAPRPQRLLIFTQFQLVLDELEAYSKYRGWNYLRLDGSTNKFVRELDIRDFNNDCSTYFVYLISTRAGGLGINLTAANHVVIYDHDWNPFIDLQAVDRAHRIGQHREVHVWNLVSEWTVEERMAFRREQKMRLDKLLVQQQLAEEEAEAAIDAEDGDEVNKGARSEKISKDEIRKLMLHGRRAIVRMATEGCEDIRDVTLENLTERLRRPLPELDEEGTDDPGGRDSSSCTPADEDMDEQNMVDLDEVMNEEAEEHHKQQQLAEGAEGVVENTGISEGNDAESQTDEGKRSGVELTVKKTSGKTSTSLSKDDAGSGSTSRVKGDLESELQNAGVLWRSGRERKKPTALYVPQEFCTREEKKKIRHELRCFVCGNPKDFVQKTVDREGKDVEITLGELICCSGCPKAYHRECEGLPMDTKKSWRCRWHECCLCFRKTSQCGNMLIHCARCPTSFCYDCFPPDYGRYNVGEDYYSQLRQRGMNVTSHNWILLLCSRCKAVEEQQSRRRLTKEEKEAEKQLQQQLRLQQKFLHQDMSKLRNEREELRILQRQRAEEERMWLEHKHRIDQIDESNELALRQAYQRLFPAKFVSEIEKRIVTAKAAQRASREAAQVEAVALQTVAADANGLTEAGRVALMAAAAVAARKKTGKKPVNQLANMKLPSQNLAVCDNCRLPCHGVRDRPGKCCFPEELTHRWMPRARHLVPCSPDNPTNVTQVQNPVEVIDVDDSPQPSDNSVGKSSIGPGAVCRSPDVRCSASSSEQRESETAESHVKLVQRQVCSACEELKIGKRAHMRKHCMKITAEQQEEYEKRRAKVRHVIELLHSRAPVQDTHLDYETALPSKLKAIYQSFHELADKILEDSMVLAGLEMAVAPRVYSARRVLNSVPATCTYPATSPQQHREPTAGVSPGDAMIAMLDRSKQLLVARGMQDVCTGSAPPFNTAVERSKKVDNHEQLALGMSNDDGKRDTSDRSAAEVVNIVRQEASRGIASFFPNGSVKPCLSGTSLNKGGGGKRLIVDDGGGSGVIARSSFSPTISEVGATGHGVAKRQKKSGVPRVDLNATLPASVGSTVALARQQKSIIDFFTSRNKAAVNGQPGTILPTMANVSAGAPGASIWIPGGNTDSDSD